MRLFGTAKIHAAEDPRAIPTVDHEGRMTLHRLISDPDREPLPNTTTVPVVVPVIEVDEDGIEWTDQQLHVVWAALLTAAVGPTFEAPSEAMRHAIAAYLHGVEAQISLDDGGGLVRRNRVAPDR